MDTRPGWTCSIKTDKGDVVMVKSAMRRCLLMFLCLLLPIWQTGCVYPVYALYSAHTPTRDVSDQPEHWGGYEIGAIYELKEDVFIADKGDYSNGPALAPGADAPHEKRDPHWRGPTTAAAYREHPEWCPDMMGVVDAGTRLGLLKVTRSNYFVYDVIDYVFYAIIFSGPHEGQTVELTELSLYTEDDRWKLRPNPRFLVKVDESK
jgi:hypothetical protein